MNRLDRYTYLAGLVLVFGGLIAFGAFAGVRVAFGVATQTLDCGAISGVNCLPLLTRLNELAQTFAIGGGIAFICGGVGLWSVRQRNAETANGEAASD